MKAARGTLQPCRAKPELALPVEPTQSITAPQLPLEIADVWAEYVDAAVAHGLRQCDADTFAEWCSMTAILRRARNAKGIATEDDRDAPIEIDTPQAAPASYVQQWRQLGELLGLAGAKSRVSQKAGAPPSGPFTNPFARNGRQQR